MKPEELLRPRYKVIADFPRSTYIVGEIIIHGQMDKETQIRHYKYPHLFKKLEWWENRKPEDMEGLYIRSTANNKTNGNLYKIKQHFTSDGDKYKPLPYFTTEEDADRWYYFTLNPEIITQAEYDAATNKS